MKYLKKFNEESEERSIEDWCKRFLIRAYTINDNNSVDVNNPVDITYTHRDLEIIPIQFGTVRGYFKCDGNKLTTLKGSPFNVYVTFTCKDNKLTTLEYSPKKIGLDFICDGNELITLEGCTEIIKYDFSCNYNNLTSLGGGPKEVSGDYYVRNNKLISLEGYPEKLEKSFHCVNNPIYEIWKLFRNYKAYRDSLDYNYLRGTNIIKLRFREALEEAGIKMPRSISGYKYI